MNQNTTIVTAPRWFVSYTTGHDFDGSIIPGCRLSVSRRRSDDPYGCKPTIRGESDGLLFPSIEEAQAHCLERGYLRRMVTPWCHKCGVRHVSRFEVPLPGGFVRRRRDAWCSKHREWA